MSQYEQENDLGSGGGEVDQETMRDAWDAREQQTDGVPAEESEREDEADAADDADPIKASPRDPDE